MPASMTGGHDPLGLAERRVRDCERDIADLRLLIAGLDPRLAPHTLARSLDLMRRLLADLDTARARLARLREE